MAERTYDESNIKVLDDTSALRTRPGMFIGSTENPFHLYREVLDNSCDEHLNGYGNNIYVELAEDESWISVRDEGRGIPVGKTEEGIPAVQAIFLKLFSGGKFNKDSYSGASSGLHGVGLSACGALTTRCEVEIHREGYQWNVVYGKGKILEPLKKGKESKAHGTKVTLHADPEIFESIVFEAKSVENRIKDLSYLLPKCRFHFTHKGQILIFQSNGLSDLLENRIGTYVESGKTCERIGDVFYMSGKSKESVVDLAFSFTNSDSLHLTTFCNTIRTIDGGTHEIAIRKIFFKVLQSFVEADKFKYSLEELQSGVWIVLHLKLAEEASFTSQTKEKLNFKNSHVIIQEALESQLTSWLKDNLDVVKQVFTLAQRRFLAKAQSSKLQALASQLQPTNNKRLKRGQIEGFDDCQSTDVIKSELFILEGQSAAGSASQARDVTTQAILPLRGKVINAFRNTATSVLGNGEIKLLLQVLGCGFKESCDPTALRYGKILILTDADPDGAHITTLLLSFFLLYLKPLIDAGVVYIIRGPLYSASKGKERIYAFTKEELDEKIQGESGWNVIRFKGWGECDPSILADIAMNPDTRESYTIRLTEESLLQCNSLMGGDSQVRKLLLTEV
jgi:topoisomerase-4 subunit B